MDIRVAAENAIIIHFAEQPSAEVTAAIQCAASAIESQLGHTLVDLTPSYTSLLVVYKPEHINYRELRRKIPHWCDDISHIAKRQPRHLTLPVYYSQESGPDLDMLARTLQMTTADIIALHSERDYRVCAIGFAPGFAYLAELDQRLTSYRHPTPRLEVPPGTVAIADRQTAVYPTASPGGWNLIGRCPALFFDPAQEDQPCTLAVGDKVTFKAITRGEFLDLGGEL